MEILTYGCAVNQADSETIEALLEENGLDTTDVIIVNTCTVKSPTENKILKKLRELEGLNRTVLVTGCIPAARPGIKDEFPSFSFIGTNIQDVAIAVACAGKGQRYVNISKERTDDILCQKRKNELIGIIPISSGCLGSCTYCQTKHARGNLRSITLEKIIKRFKNLVSEGVKEIWVTSQDNSAWGKDIGSNLPELLEAVAGVEGEFMVRVGMMNPDHAYGMLDELVESFASKKIYSFVHIPAQSGDDQVLKDMGRGYNVSQFLEVARGFESINATLSTDVIVGFPTESEQQFQNTLDLMERITPDIVNITRYWPRPNTIASKMKQLRGTETKRRSRIAVELLKKLALEKNKKWIGWSGRALVTSQNQDGTYLARNDFYKPIVVSEGRVGEYEDIRVDDATYIDLRGKKA